VTETKDPVNGGYSANGKPAAVGSHHPQAAFLRRNSDQRRHSATRWGSGKDAAMHSCRRWRLPAAAAIATPTSDAGASSQEESINPQSLRFAPRRVPNGPILHSMCVEI